jgi:hypothetical protein
MCGPTARVHNSASVRLTSIIKRSSSSETPRRRPSRPAAPPAVCGSSPPGAFTSTSIRPKVAKHRIDGAPDLVRLAIRNDRNDAPSGGLGNLRRRAFDLCRCQSIECEVGPGLGEHLGNPLADAASSPGNEGDFPVISNSTGIMTCSPNIGTLGRWPSCNIAGPGLSSYSLFVDARRSGWIVAVVSPSRVIEVNDKVAIVGGDRLVKHQSADPPPVAETAPLQEGGAMG